MSAYTPADSPYAPPQSHPHALHNPLTPEGHDPLVQQRHNLAPGPTYAYEQQAPPPQYGDAGQGNGIGGHGIGGAGGPPEGIGHEEEQMNAGASLSDGNKGNRLRKACDSCSIRKVKVGCHLGQETRDSVLISILRDSATSLVHHVEHVRPSISLVHSSVRVDDEGRQTATRRPSRNGASSPPAAAP